MALPETSLSDIERKYFSDTEGMILFRDAQVCVLSNVTIADLESKYLAVAAAFALYKYIGFIQRVPVGANMLMQVWLHCNFSLMFAFIVQTRTMDVAVMATGCCITLHHAACVINADRTMLHAGFV